MSQKKGKKRSLFQDNILTLVIKFGESLVPPRQTTRSMEKQAMTSHTHSLPINLIDVFASFEKEHAQDEPLNETKELVIKNLK